MNLNIKRYLLASFIIFIAALLWNGVLHMVILQDANSTIDHLRRPDIQNKMWLSLLITMGISLLFVFNYTKWVRSGKLSESITHGLFFALLAGVLVDANQYLVYPIPGTLVGMWFLGGVVEFSIYGVIVNKVYRVDGQA